jgi:PIN domain nuclease of toxin-antitoxin system
VNGRAEYVLDSTALLAFLLREQGAEKVAALFDRSVISSINLTETIHKLINLGSARDAAENLVREIEIEAVDWTANMAYLSAGFATLGVSHGLSLGDRACLTLASHLRATAVTSNRQWRHVHGLGVKLLIFR